MELAFLTNAVRRYFGIVIIGTLLGALPGLLLSQTGSTDYESRAVLLIVPPTDPRSLVTFSGDPDRYVAGEMSILESLSDRVAEELDGVEAGDLSSSVTFEQLPLTDVVVVAARAASPEAAQEIVATYTSVYFDVLRTQLASTQDPALTAMDEEIAAVRGELSEIDERLNDELTPFLNREVVPTPEQIAPALASERDILINRLNELQATRSEMNSGPRVASSLVREATLPTAPVAGAGRLLTVAGAIAGTFLGVLAAVVVARLSRTIIDDDQVEEVLGRPIVGEMPNRPEVVEDRAALLDIQSRPALQFLDALSVRVEAAGQGQANVTVLVTGTRSACGTTTLAASLARQLATKGPRVLLVDADRNHPELSQLLFDRPVSGPHDYLFDTPTPDLHVTSLALLARAGTTGISSSGGRLNPAVALAVGSAVADVIVIDGGALMESASTVHLSRICDVVVLAIPKGEQIRPLATVASELGDRSELLPLWTQGSGRRIRPGVVRRSSERRTDRKRDSDTGPHKPPPMPADDESLLPVPASGASGGT